MSDSWAAVTFNSTGCPRPSILPWILVPQPPRLRPRACSPWPPEPSHFFGAGGAGVGPHGGGVEDQHVQVGVAQGRQDRVPAARLGPAVEPPPLAVAVAEALGQVGPGGAGTGDPQDGVEEAAVVLCDAPVLAVLAGQQVLDAVPVGVRNGVAGEHGRPSVAREQGRHLPIPPISCPYDL